jgi:hypothetical protein
VQEKGQHVIYLVTEAVRPLITVLKELNLSGKHRQALGFRALNVRAMGSGNLGPIASVLGVSRHAAIATQPDGPVCTP